MTGPERLTVYWLEGLDDTPPLIVSLVEYRPAEKELCFYDTNRPHQFPGELVSGDAASGFVFKQPSGKTMTLRTLDTRTFDARFRKLTHNAPKFASNAELQAFYQKFFATDPV